MNKNRLKSISKWLLMSVFAASGFSAYAQHPVSCSHQQQTKKFREKLSPDQLQKIAQKSTLSAKPTATDTGQTLIIPIVFHVVHGGGQENISDAQILESVVQINEDFRATNAGQANVVPAFQSIAADAGMEFRMAELDPNGNPTTGITRRYEPLWTTDGSYYAYDIKSATQWDPTKYLNVWVVSSSDGGNGSAYAFYPADADANPVLDGVISSHWAIGRTGTAASTHYKILTHEIGHWANLKHTWGDQSNNGDSAGCSYDDGVADTPNTYGTTGCDLSFQACGGLTNVQNFMDYANCSVMFTEGQKSRMRASMFSSIAGRDNLWSASNLDATLINGRTIPRIMYTSTVFEEHYSNDGSIADPINIELLDVAFSKTGVFSSGVDFTATNVPAGLTLTINATSTTAATITLTGNATSHATANNLSNIGISFASSVFSGYTASQVLNANNTSIQALFKNPYTVVYNNINDIVVNNVSTFTYFTLEVGDAEFGGWYFPDDNAFKVETYGKAAVSNTGTKQITPLAQNTVIGSPLNIGGSSWELPGVYPGQLDIDKGAHTSWRGQTAYMGITFEMAGRPHYGWIRIALNAAGTEMTILDWAYNEEPFASIKAGGLGGSKILYSADAFEENHTNDGSIEKAIDIELFDASFAKTGNLTPGVDYTISNIPSGLTATVSTSSTTSASITLTGNATTHTSAASISNINFAFLDAAFSGSNAADITDSSKSGIAVNFNDPYEIVYSDIADIVITSAYAWEYFSFGVGDAEFGAWFNAANNFKLETYSKAAVSNATTRNISALPVDTLVEDPLNVGGSAWQFPGEYPDQLDVTTASHNDWLGQTAYVGVTFTISGKPHYGWIRIAVNGAGTQMTVLDWAYNEAPYEAIKTGQKVRDGDPVVVDPPVDYCDVSEAITNFSVNMSNVAFADLNNSSPTWTAWGDTSYRNFSAQKASVVKGDTHTLTLTISDANLSDKTNLKSYVWIDWNANGTFEVSEETEVTFSGDYSMATASITVPTDAVEGDTGMRIRITDYDTYNGLPAADRPCAYGYNGETEDYTVTVSSTLSTADNAFASALVLYPVPMNDVLHVVTPSEDSSSVSVVVYTLSGQVISTSSKKAAANHVAVGVSNLAPGAYVVKVSQSGKTATRLVIKN